MKIQHVCIGAAERLPGKNYKTGICKHAVEGALILDAQGLAGDRVLNTKHHGGPDQAVLVEGSETLDWWAKTLGKPLAPGTFGENLVIEGLDTATLAVGDRFILPDVTLEVTAPRIPCATFSARMEDPGFVKQYFAAGRPGAYCRVLKPGIVTSGDAVDHQPFQGDRVTVAEIMAIYRKPMAEPLRSRLLALPLAQRYRVWVAGEGNA